MMNTTTHKPGPWYELNLIISQKAQLVADAPKTSVERYKLLAENSDLLTKLAIIHEFANKGLDEAYDINYVLSRIFDLSGRQP